MWAWTVAGLAGGLGLYFYPAARLWAAGAVLTVLVVLVHQRDKKVLLGVAVAAIGSAVAAMPFLVHVNQHPDELAGRYAQTAVIDPKNQVRLAYLDPPEPPSELVALQVERTVGMFDRYPDGGGFLPTGRPIFDAPLAQLTLVGAAYLLVRSWRDVRLAVLSVWFWLGLSGVALTVETPDYLRSVGMLPSLCFVLAVPLLELIDRVPWARVGRARLASGMVPAGVAAILLTPQVVGYFTTFRTMPAGWGPETREGQVIAALGESGPVYSLELNEHMVSSGWVRVLAPDAERARIPNPGRELPILAPSGMAVDPGELRPDVVPASGQAMNFILSGDPNQKPYIPLLNQLYPDATIADAGDQRQSITVSPTALASAQGVKVIGSGGATYDADSFGQIPPDVQLPGDLTWRAGVRLPRAGIYTFTASAPGRVQLRLDAVPVADEAGALLATLQAAPGVHFLELEAQVGNASDHVALALGGSQLGVAQTYRLMDAPWGLLAHLNRPATDVLGAHLDSMVSMAFFDPELGFVAIPNTIIWTGSLLAPTAGVYRMAFASEDGMHLQLDGEPVDVVTTTPESWQTVGMGSQVTLSAGAHRVAVTLDISHGGRELARWNWVPPLPDGEPDTLSGWSVVPPWVLRPDPPVTPAA
jgi:hypothetical protein